MLAKYSLFCVAGAVSLIIAQAYEQNPHGPAQRTDSIQSASTVISAHGYVTELTLREQRDFRDTKLGFRGTVEEVGAARRVSSQGVEYVYRPVAVRVEKVYFGKASVGDSVTVRALGGTADGLTFSADFAPSDEVANVGQELLILGPDPIVVSGDEPVLAMTPNGVHVIWGDDLVDVSHEHHASLPERIVPFRASERLLSAR